MSEPKQVWQCRAAHKFTYETPIPLTEFLCPEGHQGYLIEGEPVVLKKKRKRAKIQNTSKVTDNRSDVEKAIDKLKREDGKIIAQKVLF